MPSPSTKKLAQYQTAPSEENNERQGECRLSSFSIRLLAMNLQPWRLVELFTITHCPKLMEQCSNLGMSYRSRDCVRQRMCEQLWNGFSRPVYRQCQYVFAKSGETVLCIDDDEEVLAGFRHGRPITSASRASSDAPATMAGLGEYPLRIASLSQ